MDEYLEEDDEIYIKLNIWQKLAFNEHNCIYLTLSDKMKMIELKKIVSERIGYIPQNQTIWQGHNNNWGTDEINPKTNDFQKPGSFNIEELEDYSEEWPLNKILSDNMNITIDYNNYELRNEGKDDELLQKIIGGEVRMDNITFLSTKQSKAHVLDNILTVDECVKIIDLSENVGFEDLGDQSQRYRNNTRQVIIDKKFQNIMFDRIKNQIPLFVEINNESGKMSSQLKLGKWIAQGCNETFRMCKYTKGQFFKKHADSFYAKNDNEVSMQTVNIYLNESFEGGNTVFYEQDSDTIVDSIVPKTGRVLIFEHFVNEYPHAGEELTDGVKQLLRTDVMYKRVIE